MIEFRRRLKTEWWKAVIAALAVVFALGAASVLMSFFSPVGPEVLEAFLALSVLTAAAAILVLFTEEFIKGAQVLRPYRTALAYVALFFGTLLALWLLAGLPVRRATDFAYLNDPACSGNPAKPQQSPLCRPIDTQVVRAWNGEGGFNAPGYLTLATENGMQTVRLTCPGSVLVANTARAVRVVRAVVYRGRVSRIAGGGLVCETSFAPSDAVTGNDLWFGLFGLVAAGYAAWLLWGPQIRARLGASRKQPA